MYYVFVDNTQLEVMLCILLCYRNMKPDGNGAYKCYDCEAVFTKPQALSRHKVAVHSSTVSRFRCPYCTHIGSRAYDVFSKHIVRIHPDKAMTVKMMDIEEVTEPNPSFAAKTPDDGRTAAKGCESGNRRRKLEPADDEGETQIKRQRMSSETEMARGQRIKFPRYKDESLEEEIGKSPQCSLEWGEMDGYTGTPRKGDDVGLACRPAMKASTAVVATEVTCGSPTAETASQTGSKGTRRTSSATQTSPRKELREMQQGTQMTPEKPLHRHVKTVTVYPNGMREEKEEFVWYTNGRQSFACCRDEPYEPRDVSTYHPTPIVPTAEEEQKSSPTVKCTGEL